MYGLQRIDALWHGLAGTFWIPRGGLIRPLWWTGRKWTREATRGDFMSGRSTRPSSEICKRGRTGSCCLRGSSGRTVWTRCWRMPRSFWSIDGEKRWASLLSLWKTAAHVDCFCAEGDRHIRAHSLPKSCKAPPMAKFGQMRATVVVKSSMRCRSARFLP